jgi:hypothetical protein
MESIFTDNGVAGITSRIDKLTPASKAQWGKMNVAQMLHHCQKPLEIPLGGETFKPNFFVRMIGGMLKKKFVKPGTQFSKNSPTSPSFKIQDERDFNTEKRQLLQVLSRFTEAGKAGKLEGRHPFFGPMTTPEWEIMQWKHLDHHLRQFGV